MELVTTKGGKIDKLASLRAAREEQGTVIVGTGAAPVTVEDFATLINTEWRKSVEGIIGAGRWLVQAKEALTERGDLTRLYERLDLGSTPASTKVVAAQLMAIARSERLVKHALPKLPASWATLYELTRLTDEEWAVVEPKLHGGFQRKHIKKALHKRAKKNTADRRAPAELWDVDSVDLRVGDIRSIDWPLASVDVIVTDPPYHERSLDCWSHLSSFARRVLKPGGMLVAMSGQAHLPEVMARLSGLTYRWTMAYLMPGGQAVQVWPRKVNTFWKPVLVYTNGESDGRFWIGDVCASDPNDNDKRFHEWGQSFSGITDLVGRVTERDDVVCDPFCGGGATVAACLHLGRTVWASDVDAEAVEVVRSRLVG